MDQKQCLACKLYLPVNMFGSNGESSSGKSRLKPRCKECNATYEYEIFRAKLERIVGVMKCSRCGYDRCFSALEFHHTNPAEKDRIIAHMRNYSEERLQREVSKCVMLCSNCHHEEHDKLRNTLARVAELVDKKDI